jgi:hypothetical protein
MGAMTELVVEALVGGALQTAVGLLGQTLANWLTRSRAGRSRNTTLTVTTPDGRTVILTAENAALAVQLLGEAPAETPSARADSSPTPLE